MELHGHIEQIIIKDGKPDIRFKFHDLGTGSLMTLLPRGMVVATAQLVDCIPTDDLVRADTWLHLLTDQEDAFGDFDTGRYAWLLENVTRLVEPVPARGALGLWEWAPAGVLT